MVQKWCGGKHEQSKVPFNASLPVILMIFEQNKIKSCPKLTTEVQSLIPVGGVNGSYLGNIEKYHAIHILKLIHLWEVECRQYTNILNIINLIQMSECLDRLLGSFINHVDRFLDIFDPLSPLCGQF